MDVAPQAEKEFTIPVKNVQGKAGIEYFVHFSVVTTQPEPLIPVGHEIAYEQFRLPVTVDKAAYKAAGPTLSFKEEGNNLIVSSSKVYLSLIVIQVWLLHIKWMELSILTEDLEYNPTSGGHLMIMIMGIQIRNVC